MAAKVVLALVVTILVLLVGGDAGIISISIDNHDAAVATHNSQLSNCRLANHQRWHKINTSIVLPLRDIIANLRVTRLEEARLNALEGQAVAGADPRIAALLRSGQAIFHDAAVRDAKTLREVHSLALSRCHNLYPDLGSPSVRPYLRADPLPRGAKPHVHLLPLSPRGHKASPGDTGGPAPASPAGTAGTGSPSAAGPGTAPSLPQSGTASPPSQTQPPPPGTSTAPPPTQTQPPPPTTTTPPPQRPPPGLCVLGHCVPLPCVRGVVCGQ